MSIKLYTASAASEIDRLAINQYGYKGLELMQRAGQSAFELIEAQFEAEQKPRILILCGAGNNGGDGYVIATLALQKQWNVTLIASVQAKTDDAKTVADLFLQAGGEITQFEQWQKDKAKNQFDVVVDALLGIGLKNNPKASIAELVDYANDLTALKVAIDAPTGVDCDTGQCFSPYFEADITISFIVNKFGLMTADGLQASGELFVDDLGVQQQIIDQCEHCAEVIQAPSLPSRAVNSHKGSFGHLVVAGANTGMLGAGLLASKAALRAGCGKVHLMSTHEHLCLTALYCPELMSIADSDLFQSTAAQADTLVLGPGLGLNDWSKSLFEMSLQLNKPTLIDADALTFLAESNLSVPKQSVLTPHPGEAARLLNVSTAEIQNNRRQAVIEIANKFDSVCVLKGAGTLIASPYQQDSCYLCDLGNPGMASAGMGDVLSGIIGALLAQGLTVLEAAKTGVWLHSYAADWQVRQTNQASLIASDVIEALSEIPIEF